MAALNPFKKPSVDPSTLTEDEQRILNKYGVPGRHPAKHLLRGQVAERKYFDSGDYAMAKAGKAEDGAENLGVKHPSPESIPHLSTANVSTPSLQPTQSQGGVSSPVKENSILQRGVSVDEQEGEGLAAVATRNFEREQLEQQVEETGTHEELQQAEADTDQKQ